ncbi:O-antigen ligase family protein [Marinobacter sediminicola]|uniref:O-antigen ligase family protein n=1 Tax=Marinobacter sediminicola TaxID=3072994 RepID=UPI0028128368|nr:O-antigen ligase family protein [Marinobacter sp. F26243]
MTAIQTSPKKFIQKLEAPKPYLELLMLACVVLFILFKRSYRDIGDVALGLLVLGTLYHAFKAGHHMKTDAYPRLFLISLIVPTASWLNSTLFIPELALPTPSPFSLYTFFIFWFLAYWIQGNEQRIALVLLAYCCGALLLFITAPAELTEELNRAASGVRVSFGLRNAQHTSLIAAFGLLASIFLMFSNTHLSRRLEIIKKLVSLLFIAIFIAITIAAQSRQAWLPIAICVGLAPALLKATGTIQIRIAPMVILYALIGIIGALATNLDVVQNRASAESSTLSKITHGDISEIPNDTSIGIRIHSWFEASHWIAERPVFGNGEDIKEDVIVAAESLPGWVRSEFKHLHSSHIETLLSYGIVGATLIYFIIIFPVARIIREKKGAEGAKWVIFSIFTLIIWLTINTFESFFYMWDGIYVFTVFYGVIYSFSFSSEKHEHFSSS